jgi:hypothetical protein
VSHHTEAEGFPPLPLMAGMQFRLRAISPTTGAAVTGVTATEWAIYGRDASGGELTDEPLPRWLPDGDESDGADADLGDGA